MAQGLFIMECRKRYAAAAKAIKILLLIKFSTKNGGKIMKRVSVDGTHFVDEDGNQILFNGLCFICREKEKGYVEPNIEEKLRFYAKRGFNLIRLGIFWDGVEPSPGAYDDEYLSRVEKVVKIACQCGIYVFLDMHQDLFSVKFIDGAPEWATLDEGLHHPENCNMWYEAYIKSPAVIKAADNFWTNKAASDGVGLLDHYERMWEHIAEKFREDENVIGLEPMNEPFMGSIAPQTFGMAIQKIMESNPNFDYTNVESVTPEETELMKKIMTTQFVKFDHDVLMPFYNRMLRGIRKVSPVAIVTGGNIYCSSFVRTGLERVTGADGKPDAQQIYAPHGYDAVVDSDHYEAYNKKNVRDIFEDKRNSQEELQMPVIVGEWGNFPSAGFTNDLIEFMNGILEKYLWSSTYHQYNEGMERDRNFDSLERGYPVSVAGNLLSYHYDRTAKKLTVRWEARKNRETRFYFPHMESMGAQDIRVNGGAKIRIERFEAASGGYVCVTTEKNDTMEISVG